MRSLISWIHLMNVFLESSVFFANIRTSNVQKEFSCFAFFCVFSSLMMDCRNFVRSSVIKMLSLLFLRFFFFIKIRVFYLPITKTAYQLTFIGPIMWERLISFSVRGCAKPSLSFTMLTISPRYDNVTLSPLLLPARVTNRSHSTYGSSARSDSHRAVFCPHSVVSGWKN